MKRIGLLPLQVNGWQYVLEKVTAKGAVDGRWKDPVTGELLDTEKALFTQNQRTNLHAKVKFMINELNKGVLPDKVSIHQVLHCFNQYLGRERKG